MSWDKTMFRVTTIPTTLSKADTAAWLGRALEIDSSSVRIHSLASDTEDSNTATVSFFTRPDLLPKPGPRWVFDSPVYGGTEDGGRFMIDISFDGFTPLSPVNTHVDESKLVDCVVVHGWGGHALGSFKEQGDSLYSWIRDDLPTRIPELRVWTYGYDAKLTEKDSIADVDDYAERFRWALQILRRDTHANEARRPLIFIVHSLGGWLFKKAMVLMSKSSDDEDKQNHLYTYGALFFGVPNQGMNTTAMASMIEGGPARSTLNFLDEYTMTKHRERENRDFEAAFPWRESKIVQFRELRMTRTVQWDDTTGKWQRNGPPELLVSRASAASGRHWEIGDGAIIEINADHSNIVKFSYGDKTEYRRVTDTLKAFVKVAHKVIGDREGESHDLTSMESLRRPLGTISQSLERADPGTLAKSESSTYVPIVFAGLFTRQAGGSILYNMLGWDAFSSKCHELWDSGHVIISVTTHQTDVTELCFTGCWLEKGQQPVESANWLYRLSDWSAFVEKHNEFSAHTRLLDFNIHYDGARLYYLGIWGSTPKSQTLVVDKSYDDFKVEWNQLESQGMRLTKIQAFESSGEIRLTGLFEEGGGGGSFFLPRDWEDFHDAIQREKHRAQLVDFQVFGADPMIHYIGVWRPTQLAHQFIFGLDWDSFVKRSQTLRSQGYRLQKAVRYFNPEEAPTS